MLWIGVVPASPKHDDGFAVACKSRELLRESNIVGGEVEARQQAGERGCRLAGTAQPAEQHPAGRCRMQNMNVVRTQRPAQQVAHRRAAFAGVTASEGSP